MNKASPLRVFTLTFNSNTHSFAPHIRYLQPDNILHDMYKILRCNLVTCTEIQIDGQYFDVWSDDEALLKDNPVPALYINDNLVIFGNLLFAKSDDEGELVGLDSDDTPVIFNFFLNQFPKLLHWLNNLKG